MALSQRACHLTAKRTLERSALQNQTPYLLFLILLLMEAGPLDKAEPSIPSPSTSTHCQFHLLTSSLFPSSQLLLNWGSVILYLDTYNCSWQVSPLSISHSYVTSILFPNYILLPVIFKSFYDFPSPTKWRAASQQDGRSSMISFCPPLRSISHQAPHSMQHSSYIQLQRNCSELLPFSIWALHQKCLPPN